MLDSFTSFGIVPLADKESKHWIFVVNHANPANRIKAHDTSLMTQTQIINYKALLAFVVSRPVSISVLPRIL